MYGASIPFQLSCWRGFTPRIWQILHRRLPELDSGPTKQSRLRELSILEAWLPQALPAQIKLNSVGKHLKTLDSDLRQKDELCGPSLVGGALCRAYGKFYTFVSLNLIQGPQNTTKA